MSRTRFILKFLGIFLFLSFISQISFIEDIFITLFMWIAKFLLLFFRQGSWEIFKHQITINGNHLLLLKECTGLPMYSLFTAFALAYDSKKESLKYLGIGLLMLVGLNIIRMFTIMFAANFSLNLVKFIHDFLWPSTYFIFTLIVSYYYIKKVKNG